MIGIILTSIVVGTVIAVIGSLLVQAYRAITPPSQPTRHELSRFANCNPRFLL